MKNLQKTIAAFAATIFLFNANSATAALVYQLENFPSDQDGAQLTGTITTDGTVDGFITEANILSWEFTVDKPGGIQYTVASTESNAEFVLGSTVDLQATITELQLFGRLQIGTDITGTTPSTYIDWRAAGVNTLYSSGLFGNTSPNGWETINPVGYGSGAWTIATVPEPSSLLLAAIAGAFAVGARRRR